MFKLKCHTVSSVYSHLLRVYRIAELLPVEISLHNIYQSLLSISSRWRLADTSVVINNAQRRQGKYQQSNETNAPQLIGKSKLCNSHWSTRSVG